MRRLLPSIRQSFASLCHSSVPRHPLQHSHASPIDPIHHVSPPQTSHFTNKSTYKCFISTSSTLSSAQPEASLSSCPSSSSLSSPSDDHDHVHINHTSIVKPARPTHRFDLYLSPSDTFYQNFFYIRDVLFYPLVDIHGRKGASFCNIQTLKDGLSKALVDFYPVAGRLRRRGKDESDNLVIDCNDTGVEFKEAVVEVDFRELQEKKFPIYDFYRALAPPTPDNPLKDPPLLSIQVTTFKDGGGIAIGIAASHVAFDGFSLWYFLYAWGQCCRGLGISLQPFHMRAVLDPKCWLDESKLVHDLALARAVVNIPRGPPVKSQHVVLHFDSHSVQQLKQKEIQESGNPSISSYQAVLASVWKRFAAAQELPMEKEVCMYLKADLRQRLTPALTPAYFGNALEAVLVRATAADLKRESIGAVAARIKKAVQMVNDNEYIRGRMAKCKGVEFMELLGELMSGRTQVLYINHGPRSAAFDVDVGMGRPLAVRPATIHSDPAIFVYPGQEKGSMDVCARFTSPQTMQAFLSIPSPSIESIPI